MLNVGNTGEKYCLLKEKKLNGEFRGKRSHRSRKAAPTKYYKNQSSQPNGCYLLRELIEGNEAGDGRAAVILEIFRLIPTAG